MRIYICGAIEKDPAYREKFRKAAKTLREIYPGSDIVNPVDIQESVNAVWESIQGTALPCDYLLADLDELRDCTHIVRIADGIQSEGAYIELAFASYAGIPRLPDLEATA